MVVHRRFSKVAMKGFTLIELIVSVGILAILFTAVLFVLNPFAQLDKANDAKRQQSLNQLKIPIEEYYADTKCYPTTIPFGSSWIVNGKTYMSSVPQDPLCSRDSTKCFSYLPDSSNLSCPQSYVVFASLKNPNTRVTTGGQCILTSLPNCLPTNYVASGYNFCITSSDFNCSVVSQSVIGVLANPTSVQGSPTPTVGATPTSGGPTLTPTPTPSGNSTPTPTPTSTPTPTPTPIVSPTPTLAPLAITNLHVYDSGNASYWSVQANMQLGSLVYGDRNYIINAFPTSLSTNQWIRDANNSKTYTSTPLVTFSLSRNATVYIGFDTRISKPAWMDSSWISTGQNIVVNESVAVTFTLYKKLYNSGTVSLGYNTSSGLNGGASMYLILVL